MESVIERDRKRVEECKDTSAKVVETCSVGDAWCQGDIKITFVGHDKPSFEMRSIKVPTQLAPGSTKGSRHGLIADGVEAFELVDSTPLEGPVLHCPNGLTVPHPEHGDITMKEPGWYAIEYQRAYAEELRRVAD